MWLTKRLDELAKETAGASHAHLLIGCRGNCVPMFRRVCGWIDKILGDSICLYVCYIIHFSQELLLDKTPQTIQAENLEPP